MTPRRGDMQARFEFERFVSDAAGGLLRSAYLIVWDLADAEDLVQECLFKVARRWPRVRKMDHPGAYARTVLVHLALDEGKGRSRRRSELATSVPGMFDDREDHDAVRVIGRVEANADLMDALSQLPPRQRAALVLRYFEDLNEAEVATVMGCSVGTVKSTTSRALDRLREAIERNSEPVSLAAAGSGNDVNAVNAVPRTTPVTTSTSEGSITR